MLGERKETEQFKRVVRKLKSSLLRAFEDSVYAGSYGKISGSNIGKLRDRFFTANAKVLEEVRKEKEEIRLRKYTCACGSYKKERFDTCYKCYRFGKK